MGTIPTLESRFSRCASMLRSSAVLAALLVATPLLAWEEPSMPPIPGRAAVLPSYAVPSVAAADTFPRSELLRPSVDFWTRVFAEFSEYQSAIHSMDYPHKVWMVLDFRDQAQERGENEARRHQRREEDKAKRELNYLLARVHDLRDTPEKMDDEERAVYELLADIPDPMRYKKAIGRFRAQRGLLERTRLALEVSGKYLPEMERVFADRSLPTTLTRLPLVESSFNVEAYSKVGAAGLWQFMPSSARIYMRLNEVVDDRRDPWTSTQAAARHLKDDYQALGSWPLAITAYNHGRMGLTRGLRETGGSTLEDLLERWDGRRFGFASRNFYAEFLAAVDVERDHRRHFGDVRRGEPLEFEVVETQHYVPYDVLRRCAGADEESFRKLNPAFHDEVVEGKLFVPPSHSIRVPLGQAESFKVAYSALGAQERFDQQRFYYAHHRVRSGDTLERIARNYGVSLTALRQANSGLNPRRLRPGQSVRIPPRGAPRLIKASAPAAAAAPAPSAQAEDGSAVQIVQAGMDHLLHKVQPGEALIIIAKRYNTTVAALKRLNNLGRSSRIRAGDWLKIPTAPKT